MRQDLGRRAAGIALAIGPCLAPASSLALAGEVTASQIHGVAPGMSQAEAHAALTGEGFMMVPGNGSQLGSFSDVMNASGRIVGSIFGYGKTGSEEFISVEIGPDAAGGMKAYRVTSMRALGEGESEATLEPMVATTFGAEPNCISAEAGMVFHYGDDMRQLSQADCSVSPLLIMGAMGEDALDMDWEQSAPRSAALALTSGRQANLIVALQDNVLAAEVQGLAGEGAISDAPAVVANVEAPEAVKAVTSDDATGAPPPEVEDDVEAASALPAPPPHVPTSVPGDNAIEIIGVTLGMPLNEILEILAAKGFKPTLDGFQINRNKPVNPEHGIVFDDFRVSGIGGRSDFSMRPTMTTYLRTDDGQSMTIGSSWDDDVFNLTYVRKFPKDGPYGDGVEIRKMLFSRGPGTPTARDPGYSSSKYAFWLMDRNNAPREAECGLHYCGKDWILSADGLWDRAERGEDFDDLDYRTYHIDISIEVDDGKQLVTDFQVILTDPSAAVPAIQEAHRQLKESMAPETTSVDF